MIRDPPRPLSGARLFREWRCSLNSSFEGFATHTYFLCPQHFWGGGQGLLMSVRKNSTNPCFSGNPSSSNFPKSVSTSKCPWIFFCRDRCLCHPLSQHIAALLGVSGPSRDCTPHTTLPLAACQERSQLQRRPSGSKTTYPHIPERLQGSMGLCEWRQGVRLETGGRAEGVHGGHIGSQVSCPGLTARRCLFLSW